MLDSLRDKIEEKKAEVEKNSNQSAVEEAKTNVEGATFDDVSQGEVVDKAAAK